MPDLREDKSGRHGEIREESRVSLTMMRFATLVVTLVTGAVFAAKGYYEIQASLRALGDRMEALDARVQRYNPEAIQDVARAAVLDAMRRTLIVCPRRPRSDYSVFGPCRLEDTIP